MVEEKKLASEYGFPELGTGIFIFNKKGEIFLIRSPKWSNQLLPCGGHVEFNERGVDTAVREAKEETGLDVINPELITTAEWISPKDFYKPNKHFVSLEYKVELVDEQQIPVLDSKEATEYLWLKPEDIVKRNDIEKVTKEIVAEFFVKQKKGLFGAKKCKDCEKMKQECAEYKAGWQRALADYKNLQKETTTRMGEWARMSERQILEEFIPVYDHLKMAINNEQLADKKDPWLEAVRYVAKQFDGILKAHDIEDIKTIGEKFDPTFHEAAGEEKAEGQEPGIIVREISSGYKMGDKVDVKVIEVKDGKISLSIKALKENPWIEAEKKYKKGDEIKGVVIKFSKHGAIASIEEGISGLVHISEFGTEANMKEKLELGKSYTFKILLFEAKNQKMGLSFVDSVKK